MIDEITLREMTGRSPTEEQLEEDINEYNMLRDEEIAEMNAWLRAERKKEQCRISQKRYRQNHYEEIKAQRKKKYQEDKQFRASMQEYSRRYASAHKEEKREYDKKYNEMHREKRRAYNRQYYQQNKEKRLQYMREYREKKKTGGKMT